MIISRMVFIFYRITCFCEMRYTDIRSKQVLNTSRNHLYRKSQMKKILEEINALKKDIDVHRPRSEHLLSQIKDYYRI